MHAVRRQLLRFLLVLPLALAGLVAPAPPAAAVSAESTVTTTSFGGDGHQLIRGATSSHGGSYTNSLSPASQTGEEGTATTAASQSVSSAGSVVARGEISASAVPAATDKSPQAIARSALTLAWTVPATGRWKVTLELRSTASGQCVGGSTEGYVQIQPSGWKAVDRLLSCKAVPGTAGDSDTVNLVAGERVKVYGRAGALLSDGAQTSSWEIRIVPVSITPVQPPQAAPAALSVPILGGVFRVGKRLNASPASWSGTPTSISYQWLRNGKPIPRATASTYRAKKADRGKRLAVRVTAANSAGQAAVTSKAVKVKKAAKVKKVKKKR